MKRSVEDGYALVGKVLGRGDGKEEDKRGIDDEELPEAQGENESRGDGEEGDRQMGDRQEE